MPLQAEGKQTRRQIVSGFTGVDLRSDSSDLGQGQLSKGINIDLYESPGVVLPRRGITNKFTGLDTPQRQILKVSNGIIHAGGTELYVNGTSISSALDDDKRLSMVEIRGQNAQTPEVFIANGDNAMLRVSGSAVENWGIEAPADAPSLSPVSSGSLTGDYLVSYTYARQVSGVIVHESNPSPTATASGLSSEDISVTVTASSDASVTHIRIYRSVAGGTTLLFDTQVANATGATTISQADGFLGAAVDEDNDKPRAATIAYGLRDRVWTNDLGRSNRIRYTKRFFPEAQPANNFVDIGPAVTQVTGFSDINGALVVFTESTKFLVLEELSGTGAVGGGFPFIGTELVLATAPAGFQIIELPSSRGSQSEDAIVSTGSGVVYPTKEGVFVTNGTAAPEELISGSIQNLFIGVKSGGIPPIDFSHEGNMVAALHRGRYYLSYTSTEASSSTNDYTMILDLASKGWVFWDTGYSSFLFDDINDEFLAGTNDGEIQILEANGVTSDPSDTDITATFNTPDNDDNDSMTRKLYSYIRVDAEVETGDTLSVAFYAGDTLKRTLTITGNRTRTLQRLPSGSMGFTWRAEITFTGSNKMKFHGIETQWKPMTSS